MTEKQKRMFVMADIILVLAALLIIVVVMRKNWHQGSGQAVNQSVPNPLSREEADNLMARMRGTSTIAVKPLSSSSFNEIPKASAQLMGKMRGSSTVHTTLSQASTKSTSIFDNPPPIPQEYQDLMRRMRGQ